MPCFSPLHAFKGRSDDSGKVAISFKRSGSWRGERLDLPCGQCVGCRLERSRQWAVRCMHEASLYDRNCFITLTYDEDHLPSGPGSCTRCTVPHLLDGSVCVSDFQNFLKKLRRQYGEGIRFYHCGEYGEQFGRPHYHALLFNHDWDDKRLFSRRGGIDVFTSDSLSRLWGKGFAVSGDVTFESAAYVARYVMKKVTGVRGPDHYAGRRPEYTTMSRRPGIGAFWFKKFSSDVYPSDRVVVRGFHSRPPRFYDGLLGREDPSSLALIKIDRERRAVRFVDDVVDGRVVKVSDNDGRRLLVREEVKKSEIRTLRRPLEEL